MTAKETNNRILIADISSTNRQLLADRLTGLGYLVDPVEDGSQAFDMALSGNLYHLMFIDCDMSAQDGYQTTRKIRDRENEDLRLPMPIVGLADEVTDEVTDLGKQSGMDEVVQKPISENTLERVLKKYINEAPWVE